ncbi:MULTISPECIES: glycoside hydrolase family 5 protein [unclassified Modestobacter]|uniref:glycoside hydrolase family 5 protein n=1 Tax=unclassified Modestobacter TaxID=2643866 RepID=UPI0022AA8476|nr:MULTISPECIES: cellulase family glycosylhydrolase [unclassified Modestobacter]MCZ2825567.1 cellulase family glycosylhydrolase [Modestobacter sp. VKM Ac-2981]MCZ2853368.1 cellulase family glycosylhydrolase [Modestobacter sp. VKM Ac-2982]
MRRNLFVLFLLLTLPACTAGPPAPEDYRYLRGVNAAGGEFNDAPDALPGASNQHYAYNQAELYEYLYDRGHRVVRIPFRWERLQHSFGEDLDPTGLAELEATVDAAADAGLFVLLDMHNYGKFVREVDDEEVKLGDGVTTSDFADAWTRIVHAFKDQPAVIGWGLMNEPIHLPDGPVPTWKVFSQAAVDAIRDAGNTRDIYVSGNAWGGAQEWPSKNGDPWITDPADSIVYEAHYYLAANNAGAYPDALADVDADAVDRGWDGLRHRVTDEITDFTDWCGEHDVECFIGEMGWPYDEADAEEWNRLGDVIYDILDAAEIGATYWAAGTRWNPDYRLQAYSYDDSKTQFSPNPQTVVIESHPSQLLAD